MFDLASLLPARAPDEARTLANGFEMGFVTAAHAEAIDTAARTGGAGAQRVVLEAAKLIEARNRRRVRRCASGFGRLMARARGEPMDCSACPAAEACRCAAASRLARTDRHQ